MGARAIIVVGHEYDLSEQAEQLKYYLRKIAGVKRVTCIPGWNKEPWMLLGLVTAHAQMAGKTPLLIAYLGHGGKRFWGYGIRYGKKSLRLPYARLAKMLVKSRRGPTLIINDCCHADSLTDAIVAVGGNFDKFGIIAACDEEHTSYGVLCRAVIASWEKRQPYIPQIVHSPSGTRQVQEKRSGVELDHHFFPKP